MFCLNLTANTFLLVTSVHDKSRSDLSMQSLMFRLYITWIESFAFYLFHPAVLFDFFVNLKNGLHCKYVFLKDTSTTNCR